MASPSSSNRNELAKRPWHNPWNVVIAGVLVVGLMSLAVAKAYPSWYDQMRIVGTISVVLALAIPIVRIILDHSQRDDEDPLNLKGGKP